MAGSNPGKYKLISWWTLDASTGATRNDSHGTNNLTDVNTVSQAAGVVNYSADFEADTNEYLTIDDNASLSFANEDMTIGVWIRGETWGSSIIKQVVGKWGTGGDNEYRIYTQSGSTGEPIFQVNNTAGDTTENIGWGSALNLATWYFVVAWHDSVNDIIGISVNAGTPKTKSWSGGIYNGTSVFRFGATNSASGLFDGRMDEAFLYRRVLTPDEITWLYNAGNGVAYSSLFNGEVIIT